MSLSPILLSTRSVAAVGMASLLPLMPTSASATAAFPHPLISLHPCLSLPSLYPLVCSHCTPPTHLTTPAAAQPGSAPSEVEQQQPVKWLRVERGPAGAREEGAEGAGAGVEEGGGGGGEEARGGRQRELQESTEAHRESQGTAQEGSMGRRRVERRESERREEGGERDERRGEERQERREEGREARERGVGLGGGDGERRGTCV
eukprot:3501852-Rhodomonas_salina.1